MVTALDDKIDTAQSLIDSHHHVGASTGYLEPRGDWDPLIARAAAISPFAVEFAALAEPELAPLEDWLSQRAAVGFRYVSVHAPVKERQMPEAELVARLAALPAYVASVVLHPDVIGDVSLYAALGRRAVIENMDGRKPRGQSVGDLQPLFDALPAAGFCLDVAHVSGVDPSMRLGDELLDAFGSRLRQVHLSSLADGRHASLTAADAERFRPLLRRCVDVPWILEAPL
ncbi:MAG TPA: hypothetical protein VNT22_02640 [Baekduia sp.]|nr:hypothetical protein [Baekduia sp.]